MACTIWSARNQDSTSDARAENVSNSSWFCAIHSTIVGYNRLGVGAGRRAARGLRKNRRRGNGRDHEQSI
eukprot:7381957-Prymnesium_polylepis.2